MNQSTNRGTRTYELVLLSMFTAIIFLLAFTPIGLIDLPFIKATILHVPVIVGSVLLGWRKGAFLGFVFGLSSLIKNTLAPSLLSFAFSPLIPVPGLDRGSLWALIICFIPRILVGIFPSLLYRAVRRLAGYENKAARAGALVSSAVAGSLTNTILVMGMIFLVFREAYAAANNVAVSAVLGAILTAVATNGIPEAIGAAVLVPVVCIPLIKVLKLDDKKIPKKAEAEQPQQGEET